ncbi:hypothetical protein JG687_00002445 [Phytophthora cactorum]|uniref:Uncharacterized protein n=1 Tax=Phytophthora cactorum TaxID=29920 RepID=A0A8T1UY88_9STRA|nr:hypothetical protein JG687_00002445 [Phytophthora cactorum]
MISQSDRTIRVTSTAAHARRAYAVCLAVGIGEVFRFIFEEKASFYSGCK